TSFRHNFIFWVLIGFNQFFIFNFITCSRINNLTFVFIHFISFDNFIIYFDSLITS
ncbi:hypothetical protein GLOIN_2v1604037, partial [Rhizophagus irregularis DAOM 181602=DAOM 197198]